MNGCQATLMDFTTIQANLIVNIFPLPRTVKEINPRITYFIVHIGTIKGGQTPQVSFLIRETPVQVLLARVQIYCLSAPTISSIRRSFSPSRKIGNTHSWKEPFRRET